MAYSIEDQKYLSRILDAIHRTNFQDSDSAERRFDEANKELEGFRLPEALMKKFDDALSSSYDEKSQVIRFVKREIMSFASGKSEDLPRYLQQFPQFDDPLRMIDGFQDDSWHTDTMPHITKFLKNGVNNYTGRAVEVYQDYLNPSLIERKPYELAKFGAHERFTVRFVDAEKWTPEMLLTTNSWDEAKDCAMKAVALQSIDVNDLASPKTDKKAVNQFVDALVECGMDSDSINKFFSKIKTQAVSHAKRVVMEQGKSDGQRKSH